MARQPSTAGPGALWPRWAPAYEDMYADTKMIREKRAKRKMMQQGHKP